jgi:polyhydroxyalkanoate synthesis regulator phasin
MVAGSESDQARVAAPRHGTAMDPQINSSEGGRSMRTAYLAWLGALVLAGTATASSARAQEGASTSARDEIELTRASIQTRRQEIVQSLMELSEAESEKFWPVYHEYRNQMTKLGDERVKFIERFAGQAGTMSDEESKKLLDDWFKLRERQLDLQKKYAGKFRKVLPGPKVARFYQVENAMDTIVSANLQAAMPVAGNAER